MSVTEVYLRQNVCVRPLIGRWLATEQHVPPVQAALNVKNVQLEILRSYVEAPEFHWKATQTPALIGGPWLEVPPERAKEVEAFLTTFEARSRERVQLARDVEALDRLLRDEAKGGGLVPLYPRVPDALRGYVELAYDASHQPSARYFESLLYRSKYYDASLQEVALHLLHGDHRAPAFTTPVLDTDPVLLLRRPFASEALDELFLAKTQARSFGELCERLGVTGASTEMFRAMFTTDAPRAPERSAEPSAKNDGLRVRYFGHACVLLETAELSILVDPVISYGYEGGPDRYTYADLPEHIDFVALTHFHKDHVNLETLLQLRCRVGAIIVPKNQGGAVQDPSFRLMLENIGFKHVIELDRFETLRVAGGEVTGLPFLGEHADLDVQAKCGYNFRLANRSVVCAADAANVEPRMYGFIRRHIGEVDMLFLGMECVGAPLTTTYGGVVLRPLSREFDQQRRTTGSDYAGAMGIVRALEPKEVYIYAMGLEPWLGHLLPIENNRDALGITESDRVVAECRQSGLMADRPHCKLERQL
ncbi:MAG TPA: MBL fold metallo-hydrolase [Kofleriaceae bacterium]